MRDPAGRALHFLFGWRHSQDCALGFARACPGLVSIVPTGLFAVGRRSLRPAQIFDRLAIDRALNSFEDMSPQTGLLEAIRTPIDSQ